VVVTLGFGGDSSSSGDGDRLLLLQVKNNIGAKVRGVGYRIGVKQISKGISAPHVVWDDAPVDFTADQALAATAAARRDGGALAEAKEFLSGVTANLLMRPKAKKPPRRTASVSAR
jgi:hypothetical protein